jgi:hypothetical protein
MPVQLHHCQSILYPLKSKLNHFLNDFKKIKTRPYKRDELITRGSTHISHFQAIIDQFLMKMTLGQITVVTVSNY